MKHAQRIIAICLAFALAFSLCGCKSTSKTAEDSTSSVEESAAPAEETSGVDTTEDDMKELEAIGDVEVENGILTVSITVPADLVGETTQETLDAGAGDNYTSAKLNDDGSVTYKMTKAQYHNMLSGLQTTMDDALQEMVDNDDYAFTSIEHNDDFTQFDCTVSTDTVGLTESFMALAFYMYGGMYEIFSGNQGKDIIVNYYGPDGTLLDTASSANMAS